MRQALGAAQAEPQSAAAGEAIAESLVDVRNAGAVVFKHDPQAGTLVILDHLDLGCPPAAILERISGQFARIRDSELANRGKRH